MRVLIDESLPIELAEELPFPKTSTVRAQEWLGLRNGVLLRAAVVVMRVRTRIEDLRPLLPAIIAAIPRLAPSDVAEISA